jgi:hypothetical protein
MISSFHFFSFPSSDMADFFFSNFKRKISFQISKMKVSIFSFQISKTQIFKFFHLKFSWHISKFFISLWWYGQFFSNFNSNFKIEFFVQFSHFPLVVWTKFSKFKNKKFQFKFQKQHFSFQIFLVA